MRPVRCRASVSAHYRSGQDAHKSEGVLAVRAFSVAFAGPATRSRALERIEILKTAPHLRNSELMFTIKARMATLNTKDTKPCATTRRRMSLLVTCTSDTWNVMPTTKEK